MKAVFILSDSLNRHFLSSYGNDWVKTPNIARFAKRSVVFDNHWTGSSPCMPARRDIITGRLHFLEREWGGLEPFDVPFPRIMRDHGIFTHMVTDHYHYFHVGGENYHTPFDTWELIRGQEFDVHISLIEDPAEPEHLGRWDKQYEKNRTAFKKEEDFSTPKTFQGAVDWLKQNEGADDFFLWVEAFDPHEPFDCTEEYRKMYEDDWEGPLYNWSGYEHVDSEDKENNHLKKQYAATLTMMDNWFGKLLDELERQGIDEETLIIFTTDHGHMLGEHGVTGKNFWHAWNEMTHIPLMVHLPGDEHAGERRNQLTQNIDILPTLFDYFGIPIPQEHELSGDAPEKSGPADQDPARSAVPGEKGEGKDGLSKAKQAMFQKRDDFHPIHGESWKPILEENAPSRRKACLYGWYGRAVNITDGEYTYFRSPVNEENQPLYRHFLTPGKFHLHDMCGEWFYKDAEFGRFLPYTHFPVIRSRAEVPRLEDYEATKLFNIVEDYQQLHDLSGGPEEKKYKKLLEEKMAEADAPGCQYERLGLRKPVL